MPAFCSAFESANDAAFVFAVYTAFCSAFVSANDATVVLSNMRPLDATNRNPFDTTHK